MSPSQLRLYLVTDRGLSLGRDLLWVVREAVAGGVTIVQLREKDAGTRDFVALGRQLVEELRPLGVPLIINDRVDVALRALEEAVDTITNLEDDILKLDAYYSSDEWKSDFRSDELGLLP